MIADTDNVARAIFSPRMINNGMVLPMAFELRPSIREEYLSVMTMSVDSWMSDISKIPQYKNRRLFGYAKMNVSEIRNIDLPAAKYDVRECPTENAKSHSGIFIKVYGLPLIGGEKITKVPNGYTEDFYLLALRRELVNIAQKGLVEIVEK